MGRLLEGFGVGIISYTVILDSTISLISAMFVWSDQYNYTPLNCDFRFPYI